jgi:FkbM family methyltransferase
MNYFSRLKQKALSSSNKKGMTEMERLKALPIGEAGYAHVFQKPFRFHHAASFVATYKEIFQDEFYKFNPKVKTNGVILDCCANMGLSVLYFAMNYPNHKIIAFEPEKAIYDVIKENLETFKLTNVTLYDKAVWTEETELTFHSDGGMGGRVNNVYKSSKQPINKVKTVALKDLLDEKVDFLKIDIEGAEDEVLNSCRGHLRKVQHVFFEYHNNVNKPQTLHELLALVKDEGFKYHIKESSTRRRPFVDHNLICETFDMAITVFCYK